MEWTHINAHELSETLEAIRTEDGLLLDSFGILKALLDITDYDSIERSLFEFYPDEARYREDYRKIYSELRVSVPVFDRPVLLYLEDQTIESDDADTEERKYVYYDVKGIDPETGLELKLENFSWIEWLAFRIFPKDVEETGAAGYLAHCFYKMTLHGYNPEDIKMNLELGNEEEPIRKTNTFLSGVNIDIVDNSDEETEETHNDPQFGQIQAEKGFFGKLLDYIRGKK